MTERQARWSRFTGKSGAIRLWAPWLIGPAAWAFHQVFTYWLSSWMCTTESLWMFHAATAAAATVAAAGGAFAWHQWRTVRGMTFPDRPEGTASRIRFQAVVGIGVCAASLIGILLEGLPNVVLDPCVGVP